MLNSFETCLKLTFEHRYVITLDGKFRFTETGKEVRAHAHRTWIC